MAAELLTLLFHVVWAVSSGLEPVLPPVLKLPDRRFIRCTWEVLAVDRGRAWRYWGFKQNSLRDIWSAFEEEAAVYFHL